MRGKSAESDRDYYLRRAREERAAAEAATHALSRDVHEELAKRYDGLAEGLAEIVPIGRIAS